MMDFTALAETYANQHYNVSRDAFIRLALANQARIDWFEHPRSPKPDGTVFGVDTAWFGPDDAETVLIMISGTHGPELFSGSAMQRLWIETFQRNYTHNFGVLLIHAINPYGCAYGSRTTENNVDLNRNFVSFPLSYKASGFTDIVQDALSLSTQRGARQWSVIANLLWLSARYGRARLMNEVTRGQYQRQDGIGFGGFAPEWSNTTLQTILHKYAGHAKRAAIIDWHTGIGAYGDPYLLCFDEPGTAEYERAADWWGQALTDSTQGYDGEARPDYQGLLLNHVKQTLQQNGAETVSSVIEFGTYANRKMLQALLCDRWLRCWPDSENSPLHSQHQAYVRQMFCPDDPDWRERVLRQGYQLLCQTFEGLQLWDAQHA